MRLLNTSTLKFQEFENEDEIPIYVILSHTWNSPHEVSYQEMMQITQEVQSKSGFEKITNAAQKALKAKIDWIWIDTCCIDKNSSAELTEAINCKLSIL